MKVYDMIMNYEVYSQNYTYNSELQLTITWAEKETPTLPQKSCSVDLTFMTVEVETHQVGADIISPRAPTLLFICLPNKPFLNYVSIKDYSSLNITSIMWLLSCSIPLSLEPSAIWSWPIHPASAFHPRDVSAWDRLGCSQCPNVLRAFIPCAFIHTSLCLEVSSSVSLPRKHGQNTGSFI